MFQGDSVLSGLLSALRSRADCSSPIDVPLVSVNRCALMERRLAAQLSFSRWSLLEASRGVIVALPPDSLRSFLFSPSLLLSLSLSGGNVNDFLHGWLNYQIEHHMFADLSMLSYQATTHNTLTHAMTYTNMP